jgi:hypothetical protein
MRKTMMSAAVTLALLTAVAPVNGQSVDALINNMLGTWKLDVAKSTFSPGPGPRSNTITIERWENGQKATSDGIDAQGKPTHTEQLTKFDGKDYPRKGAPAANTTRSYKAFDHRTYESVEKVDGQVTITTGMVISPDGKTRTLTAKGKDPQGRMVNDVTVYQKQ